MRLYCKAKRVDWSEVFARIAGGVTGLVRGQAGAPA
jgi:hypothetical protein